MKLASFQAPEPQIGDNTNGWPVIAQTKSPLKFK